MKKLFILVGVSVILAGCAKPDDRPMKARAQVRQWVEELDNKTNVDGPYQRHEGVTDTDPWGNPLQVSYSVRGRTETLMVRSAGPDGLLFSDDDLVENRSRVRAKALTKAMAEAAEEGAKGTAKGLIEGVKEGLKTKAENKAEPQGPAAK